MSDLPLEDTREILAALLGQLGYVVVRTSGVDFKVFEVVRRQSNQTIERT